MEKRLIIVLIILLSIGFVNAADCIISAGCSNPIGIYASDSSNAHLSNSGGEGYLPICCAGYTGLTTVISINADCGEDGVVAFLMSSNNNAHIAQTNYPGYSKQLCLKNVGGQAPTCTYATTSPSYSCPDNYFCLLEYKEVPGFIGTNAHVASCGDSDYDKKVCCGVGGTPSECLQPMEVCTSNEQCCDTGQGTPTVQFNQYCSYGQFENNPLPEGHCCQEGSYWYDPDGPGLLPGYCRVAFPCYDQINPSGDPNLCNIILTSQNAGTYFTDSGCVSEELNLNGYYEACCYSDQYGAPDYYYCDITPIQLG